VIGVLRNAAGKVSWGGRAAFLTFGLAVMAALVAGILVLMTLIDPAEAPFPGANGRIAFTSNRTGNFEIFQINPDGSHRLLMIVVRHTRPTVRR
jgi:hypothetical protein